MPTAIARPFPISSVVALAWCELFTLSGCRKKPVIQPQAAPASSSAELGAPAAPPAVVARCRMLQNSSFTIGEAPRSAPPAEAEAGPPDEDDEVPPPFSVELGQAKSFAGGFAVGALRSERGKTHAFAALIGVASSENKLIDLGQVHGDPDPPVLAVHHSDLVVAVSDADAGGTMLRLGVLRVALNGVDVHFGADITGVRSDLTIALETSQDRAFLVYADAHSADGRVVGASFDPANPKIIAPARALSAAGDLESPRLVARPGGFWLGYARSIPASPSGAQAPNAGLSPKNVDPEGTQLVDPGVRRIELLSLDANGKALGAPRAITKASDHPLTFELALAADAGALVAFRDDDSPGDSAGPVRLVHVRLDGSLEAVPVEGGSLGIGAPSLLVDADDPAATWLSATDANGATWFGRVLPQTVLTSDPSVRGAELLAAKAARLLIARSKGTAAELSVIECPGG